MNCDTLIASNPNDHISILKKCSSTFLNFKNKLIMKYKLTSSCCLPTPLTLISWGGGMFPLVVHQPAYSSIWFAALSGQQGLPTNPVVSTWCVCGCS